MRRYNPEELYKLAGALGPVMSFGGEDRTLRDVLFPIWLAQDCLTRLLASSDLKLSVATVEKGKQLETAFTGLAMKDEDINAHKELDAVLTSWQLGYIKDTAKEFETHFIGDCLEQHLYIVPQVQAYDTRTLLEEGEKLIAPSAAVKLSNYPKALDDVRTAARCLAFDLWTATGFHIARATEMLLQEYWKQVRGKTLPAKGARTWVALCRELKGRPATTNKAAIPPAGTQSLVDFLTMIGDQYRNPLIHPEHTLDEMDGNLLLEGCKAGITKLLSELP